MFSKKNTLDEKTPSFRATSLVVEDFIDKNNGEHVEIDLDISFGFFNTKEEAEEIAKKVSIFVQQDIYFSDKKILLAGIADTKNNVLIDTWIIDEKDIVFRRIKEEKRAKMGEPLDPKNADSLNKIKNSLDQESPLNEQYMISEDDMEIINYDLNYFLSHYSINTSLQNVAYGYKDMTKK